ncbi:unnamed protein product [Rotaria sordida]|uniref:E3 ubiquitin-protein ligase n=1 Tax=Rotaria sordida TaxID=392033 RepID=A0A814MRJ5_9BILA|nr:unnamed protein product [Rotaria sordida]CAF3660604.1 unnamed protein product [Rotaria sordida]
MSSMRAAPPVSSSTCEWCSQQTFRSQSTKLCQHRICNQCIFIDKQCESDCPICWYINGAQFIHDNRICSVCCNGINPGDKILQCSKNHPHCPQCYVAGCVLCQFRKLKSWSQTSYRDLPASSQRILYVCHIWQMKFEEVQKCVMNSNILLSKKDPSLMDVDNKQHVLGPVLSLKHKKKPSTDEEIGDCMICLEHLGSSYHKLDVCGHLFHKSCIDQWFESNGKQSCPSCGYVYGISSQPPDGRMTYRYINTPLPGFENENYEHGQPTIEITYLFPPGIQGSLNPKPGKSYPGTTRSAYLPNNKEGNEVLRLLRRAFDDQHIFTIGRSATTGQDNVITWNDIHHKTNIHGGPDRFGYPDPTYLFRVRQELADKGYK